MNGWCLDMHCTCGFKQYYESKGKQPRKENHKKAKKDGWKTGKCPKCNEIAQEN